MLHEHTDSLVVSLLPEDLHQFVITRITEEHVITTLSWTETNIDLTPETGNSAVTGGSGKSSET